MIEKFDGSDLNVDRARGSRIKVSARQATFDYLDSLKEGDEFSGLELASVARAGSGDFHYPATTLRYMRIWRSSRMRNVKCLSKKKSLYRMMD